MPQRQIVEEEVLRSEAPVALDDLVRQGAQKMIQKALELEVSEFIRRHSDVVDAEGNRQVVRNGFLPAREVVTGAGPLKVKQPRVRDNRHPGGKSEFTSKVLPPYLRRTKNVDELIPWLYLRGISTNDMQPALEAILGPKAMGLSPSNVNRMTTCWQAEVREWQKRDLTQKEYVYIWADGIHFNVRLEEDRQCILVLMGATKDGNKELIAIHDGYRESAQSWKELLLSVKAQGLNIEPKLAIADGALGFWKAVGEVFPTIAGQRCWVHKTANIVNKLPKSKRSQARTEIHDIWMAEKREGAHKAFDLFVAKYQAKYPKASECLEKDREQLLTFYDFPAEHWVHLRTSNPIESTFGTVRHRQKRTKGAGSRQACFAMVFKLADIAQKRWRRLKGYERILQLVAGDKFVDGIHQERNAA